MRDWLYLPAWRSAVIIETAPDGAKWVGYDLYGWKYFLDGLRLVATRG
jgi:hypothetical protein